MKTRKILALVMAIALLAVSMTVVASATEERPTSAYSIIATQTKTKFVDTECFDATGLVISDGTTNIAYDTDKQYFTFSVAADQPLTVYITEIEVFYKGASCGFITGTENLSVTHAGGAITPVNHHGHGQICDGCGVICKNESHTVPYWVPNGDAALLTNETETGTCSVCGDTVSQYIPNTATYATIFADYGILVTILGLVSTIVQGFALI